MLGGIAGALGGIWGRRGGPPVDQPGVDPPPDRHRSVISPMQPEPVQRRSSPRILQHHSARDHALLLISWVQVNVNSAAGMLFHDEILEFYTEALIEAGWYERSWNPVARELDLICTGGRKPYEWTITKTGQKRRRRVYPLPVSTLQVTLPALAVGYP